MPNLGNIATAPTIRWDARTLALSNGAAVGGAGATWAASIGSIALSNATGTQQPIFSTDIGNGLPGVVFDGNDDLLRASNLFATGSWADALAILIVCRSTRSNSYTAQGVAGVASDNNTALGINAGVANLTARLAGVANPFASTPADNITTPGSKPLGPMHVVWMSWDGDKYRAGDNQCEMEYSPGSVDATFASNNFLVGKANNGFALDGPICDVVVYNAALPLADLRAIRDDLATSWAGLNSRPRVYLFGDSITSPESNGWSLLASGLASIKSGWWQNYAVNGAQVDNVATGHLPYQVTQAIASFSATSPNRIGVFFCGTNDIRASSSSTIGASVYALFKAQAAAFLAGGGTRVIGITMLPSTSGAHANFESINRPAFNNALRADGKENGGTFWDRVVNLDADARLGNPADAAYSDQLHPSLTGAGYVAQDVVPAILATLANRRAAALTLLRGLI